MGLLDGLSKLTGATNSDAMGQAIEEMVNLAVQRRRSHERRWFDNGFFDDGFHFRIVSKKTGQVVDTINKTSGYVERAIPLASRQIRGVANLLFAAEPYPVIYPRRISMSEFTKQGQLDQQSYMQAVEQAKDTARKQGIWLSNEWEDGQQLDIKLIDMILKASRNSVAWLQITSDADKQKIITEVFDAFDVICYGDVDDEQKLPFITKTKSMTLDEIKSSSLFDPAKVAKLTPDNKYATSEIKDAYMRSRYGVKTDSKGIVIKDTLIKEYLSDDNWKQAQALDTGGAMEGKSKGDMIMRQVFSGSGVTLNDSYVDYDLYPLAAFRFEPGPLYQVPFIERFKDQNKSVDIITTRIEKWVNSMVVGVYQQRKGENMQVTNFPGGQKLEYETTPLAQMNVASVGGTPFQLLELLNTYIEQQGASTSALNQLPSGVKSGVAIEHVKSTEYANLKIPTLMLKNCIRKIAEIMLERAHKDFLEPVEVSHMQDGEPQYFDVIGKRGYDLSKKVNKPLPEGIVPLDKDAKLRIEIEPGLGLTMEGKKEAMQQINDYLLKLYQEGFIAPEAMQQVLKKFLETYGYGSTEEFMEAMENGITGGQMSDNQIKQIQVALVQTLKDAQLVGPQADQKLVTSSKIGTLESLKEAGLLKKMQGDSTNGLDPLAAQKAIIDDMSKIYKDSPPDVRRQIEQALGMHPSSQEAVSPSQVDSATKIHSMANTDTQTGLSANQQQQDTVNANRDHQLKQDTQKQQTTLSLHDLEIKRQAAKQKAQTASSTN